MPNFKFQISMLEEEEEEKKKKTQDLLASGHVGRVVRVIYRGPG